MQQLLPKEDSHFWVAPPLLQIAEILLGRLFLALSGGHHPRHGSVTMALHMSMAVLALRSVLVLLHCYK